MARRAVLAAGILVALAAPAPPARGAEPKVPPELAADPPVLRLEAGGPTAPTYALAFGPGGRTLYAAGFDKVVRTWGLRPDGAWVLLDTAYRVPIGPDTAGVINCLAVSPDNKWLAVGGVGVVAGESRYADQGQIFRIRPARAETDRGTIFLFPIAAPGAKPQPVRRLVGHRGPVVALAFAPGPEGGEPVLISAAREPGHASATSSGRVIAWQVPGADRLGECPLGELYPRQKPPALAARRTGADPRQVRVAVAWEDGHLHVWDVAQKAPRTFDDGALYGNSTAVYTAAGELVTGGYHVDRKSGKGTGYLHFWADGPGEDLKTVAVTPLQLDGYDYLLALGLAPVPTPSGKPDQLAVLLRSKPQNAERAVYQLGLVSLASRQLVPTVPPIPLWDEAPSRPVLAASPDGRYVAVAGADQPTVRVYAVADLRAGRPDHQTLHSVGVSVRRVAFAALPGARLPVLGLSVTRHPFDPDRRTKQDFVFDFVNRDLTERGWEAAGAAEDGWAVIAFARKKPGEPWLIDWQRPGGRPQRSAVRLDVAQEVTAAAVVPPVKDVTEAPVLAVAAWDPEKGQPLLALYDTRGDGPPVQVRQLRGHVQPVHSLAVSRDGRFLASAADDQTVCLWSLTDLNEIIGRHGALLGVDLVDGKQGPAVEHLDPGSPASRVLRDTPEADVIKGLAFRKDDPKPLAPADGLALCEELWKVKPGRPFWLTVRREENGKPADVTVELAAGQAVDDRKPLLSLFLADLEGREPEWIAWTPAGPYDAGGKEIEDYVGWQRNPKRIQDPATFAPLNLYRGNFYEPHLLRPLLARGDLPGALEEINRPPAPRVRLTSPRPGTADGGPVLVRDPSVPLALTVEGPSLKEQVTSVVVEVDGRKDHLDLATADGQNLSKTVRLGGRGEHTVRVTATTTDGQSDTTERHLVYFPPPPRITLPDLAAKQTVVSEEQYPLHARVEPGRAGQELDVRLFRMAGNKAVPVALAAGEIKAGPNKGTLEVEKKLTLVRGENRFRLEAVNRGALQDHETEETADATFVVEFVKEDTPRVAFTEAELDAGTEHARKLPAEPGKPLLIDRPTLRLRGRVTAPDADLDQVQLRGGGRAVPLRPQGRTYGLDRDIGPLKADERYEFTLAARTLRSDEGTAVLVIQYQPPLAALDLTAPLAGARVVEGPDRAGPPDVEVKGTLALPDDSQPFDVVLRVRNGEDTVPQGKDGRPEVVVPFAGRPDAGGGEPVSLGTVRLGHGINRIEAWVRNKGREGPRIERTVSFLRPPFILDGKATLDNKKLRVRARITAPADVPLDRVVIQGRDYAPGDAAGPPAADGRKVLTWAVDKVIEYPLGKKTLALSAVNADDRAETTIEVPPPPLPEDLKVEVRGPQTVDVPSCTLHVDVKSLSPLGKLQVLRNGRPVAEVPVAKQRPDERENTWELEDDVVVQGLEPGVNALRVEAVNRDNRQGADHPVTYRVPQLRLELAKPEGVQPASRYTLRGKVLWEDPGQSRQVEEKLRHLRVTVNGFRQPPPAPPQRVEGEQAYSFSVDLRLNGNDNKVEVVSPDLPIEPDRFKIECADPEKPGRLHLLIVNAGKNTVREQDLVRRALGALQLQGPGLHSGAFSQVISYSLSPDAAGEIRPLVGQAARKQSVEFLLNAVKETVRKDRSPSDVVLIYWLGEEAADDRGEWYLKTRDSLNDPKAPLGGPDGTGVRLRDLVRADDDEVVGARVVLLDVVSDQRPGGPRPFDWARSDAAVIRYAWSRGVPVPQLLVALEDAGRAQPRVTLEQVAQRAKALQAARHLPLLEMVAHLSGLGEIILAGKPSAQGP